MSVVTGRGLQMKKLKGKTNQRNGRKGEESTAKQPRNTPFRDRAIKGIRKPHRRHTSGSLKEG